MINKVGLNGGTLGIEQTLIAMRDLIVASDLHREVKDKAAEIIQNVQPTETRAQIDAIVAWVRAHMKYVRDIRGVEEVSAPWVLLGKIQLQNSAYGDCDDYATLLGALLRAVGFRTRLEALAVEEDRYNHARMAVYDGGEWLAVEGTKPWPLGDRYPSNLDVLYVEPQG